MPYDHFVPFWDINITRTEPLVKSLNNVLNGIPIYGASPKFSTVIYPSRLPSVRLPVLAFDKRIGEDMFMSMALPFAYKRPTGVAGQRLVDQFESAPKIHCGMDFGVEDGTFLACVSLDILTVFEQLRSDGVVDSTRTQKWVKVDGRIDNYVDDNFNPFHLTCSCLLAPPTPRVTPKYWCKPDCPVEIERREYVNCTQAEVINGLVDLETYGLNIMELDYRPGATQDLYNAAIVETTRTRSDMLSESRGVWGGGGSGTGWGQYSPTRGEDDVGDGGGWGAGDGRGGWGSSEPGWKYLPSSD